MNISGVQIADGVRLLVARPSRLFHHVDGDEWCETVLPARALKGSVEDGDLRSGEIACGGGHMTGYITEGQWIENPTEGGSAAEEPTDG